MAQNSEELNHHHSHNQHLQHHPLRRVQNINNRQINDQLIGTSTDGLINIQRNIHFIQSESWRDHYKLLTRQLKEELRQNPDIRRSFCYKDGNSSSQGININCNHNSKYGQQPNNSGNKSKIPVKQNGTTLSTNKRNISDSNSSIVQRDGDVVSQFECQICRVKEIRSNLLQLNKVVVEQNEKILRLKAKYLRDYFERQMMD